MELGPCRISDANGPRYHLESWNQNANIFFVDQPVAVGFSYAEYGESVVCAQPCFTALIGLLSPHVGRALPKKLRKISQRLCQYSLRTSPNSKVVRFTWRENRMGYARRFTNGWPLNFIHLLGPICSGLRFRGLRSERPAHRGWTDAHQSYFYHDRLVCLTITLTSVNIWRKL